MDFISKLGSKAGETFQSIKDSDQAKKAKNLAGIPGLSMQVGKQEQIVKKAYQDIGEAYYKANKDNEFDTYASIMQTITDAMETIEKLKAEIEEKKNYDPSKDNSRDVVDNVDTEEAVEVESTTDTTEE